MWHWLRSGLLKNLWGRLAAVSLTLHLCALAALFLSGQSSEFLALDLSKVYDSHAKIVLLPFYRVVPAELNKHRGGGSGGGTGKGGRNTSGGCRPVYATTGAVRPATTLVHLGPSAADKRRAEKKRVAEKKRQAKLRAEKKAKLLKKQQERKRRLEEKREKLKEAARKKAEHKKRLAEEKRLKLQQAALEKAPLEKAPLEKELQEKVFGEGQKNTELENPSSVPSLEGAPLETVAVSGEGGGGDGSGGENIIYVGRDEIELYRENTELRDALAEVWHPPVGIEPERSCTLEVVVDKNGTAAHVSIKTSSGIVMYDSAAQAALYEVVFPERQYGKALQITFK